MAGGPSIVSAAMPAELARDEDVEQSYMTSVRAQLFSERAAPEPDDSPRTVSFGKGEEHAGTPGKSKALHQLGPEGRQAVHVSKLVGDQQRRLSSQLETSGVPDHEMEEACGDRQLMRRASAIKAMEQQGVAFTEHGGAQKGSSCCVLQ